MEGYTEDDFRAAGLSPEEIAAMQEEEQQAEQQGLPVKAETETDEQLSPEVAPPPPDQNSDDEGGSGTPAEVAAPEIPPTPPDAEQQPPAPTGGEVAASSVEEPPAKDEKTEAAPEKSSSPGIDPFAPKYVAPEVTEEAFKTALSDLRQRRANGEIDDADYIDAVTDLKAEYAVAKFAQANNEATASQQWSYAVEAFKAVHPEYQNPAMLGALDGMVRSLAQSDDAKGLNNIQFLSLADEKVKEALGLGKPKDALPSSGPETPPATPQAPERKPALEREKDKIPPSLGSLPAAQSNQPEDEFADLNKMTGMEQEAAVAAMQKADPAKYQRWLQG